MSTTYSGRTLYQVPTTNYCTWARSASWLCRYLKAILIAIHLCFLWSNKLSSDTRDSSHPCSALSWNTISVSMHATLACDAVVRFWPSFPFPAAGSYCAGNSFGSGPIHVPCAQQHDRTHPRIQFGSNCNIYAEWSNASVLVCTDMNLGIPFVSPHKPIQHHLVLSTWYGKNSTCSSLSVHYTWSSSHIQMRRSKVMVLLLDWCNIDWVESNEHNKLWCCYTDPFLPRNGYTCHRSESPALYTPPTSHKCHHVGSHKTHPLLACDYDSAPNIFSLLHASSPNWSGPCVLDCALPLASAPPLFSCP